MFYAIYKGDTFMYVADTIEECAEFLNVKRSTALFLSYAPHHKRATDKAIKIYKYKEWHSEEHRTE